MRIYRIFTSLAIFSLLLGAAFAPEAVGPRSVTVVFTIPAGATWFVQWGFEVLTTGAVSGHFVASSGGVVGVYIMTQAQRDDFVLGHPASALVFVQGSSGNYSGPLAGGGKYFLVVVHGPESEELNQSGSAFLRISAVSTWPFLAMSTGTVAAVALAVVGFVLRARSRETAGPVPAPSAVLYFEPPPPPG